MGEPIKVFFLEPTDREKRWLRRYGDGCSATGRGYCDGMYDLGEGDIRYTIDGMIEADREDRRPPKTDPRWPTKCDRCGKPFEKGGTYQLFTKQIYVRPDTGFRCTLADAPPGAVWDAWWVSYRYKRRRPGQPPGPLEPAIATGVGKMIGPDGRCLVVRLPDGHDWMIDSRASNCTLPQDNSHHCWVRTGRPEDGTLHVDKNGNTCAAGAGSILTDKWHGFLHNGMLHE